MNSELTTPGYGGPLLPVQYAQEDPQETISVDVYGNVRLRLRIPYSSARTVYFATRKSEFIIEGLPTDEYAGCLRRVAGALLQTADIAESQEPRERLERHRQWKRDKGIPL